MLLRALEEKRFLPVGADAEAESDFQLIAGTNRDLREDVQAGRFRADLLARINLWTFMLPGLRERREDIEPNVAYELERYARTNGRRMGFSQEARQAYLAYALAPEAEWRGNFRDLNASVTRMATLAPGGRITEEIVREEIERLRSQWLAPMVQEGLSEADAILAAHGLDRLDRFERVQLRDVIEVCLRSRSLSDAGRELFAVSRLGKSSSNDADRLRKYLARFRLTWKDVSPGGRNGAQLMDGAM